MPTVIADTSPLQYLHQADVLPLLPALFGEVLVPQAVVEELRAGHEQGVSLPVIGALPWLLVRPVQQPALCPPTSRLGEGEREVLALGLEMPGSLLILDDRLARCHAEALSMKVTGTLGVLLLAKQRGRLEAVGPVLDRLDNLGFRLHPATRQFVLNLAGESG